MSHTKEVDEKKLPGYVLGTELEGAGSFDTITALVAEGETGDSFYSAELTIADHEHEIKLRTMSWQKTACLLSGEQVCLAIMAQSWSLS